MRSIYCISALIKKNNICNLIKFIHFKNTKYSPENIKNVSGIIFGRSINRFTLCHISAIF